MGILAVDKSVYLMKASNDIIMENVSLAVSYYKNPHEREMIAWLQISKINLISSFSGEINNQESFQMN